MCEGVLIGCVVRVYDTVVPVGGVTGCRGMALRSVAGGHFPRLLVGLMAHND